MRIRTASSADYAAFAALFAELRLDEPVPSVLRWASDLARQTLVADDAGVVRGYVTLYALGTAGHVRNLVVAPAARNAGVGRALMDAAADTLRSAGATEWYLHVKAANAAAIHLYEKLGMRAEHRSTVVRLRWADVAKLPAELATVIPASREDDDDAERAFALPTGRLAMARRPGRIVLQLRDRDLAVTGVAVFDPDFGGASPFHVARPALATPLLASLRRFAKHEHVQIVVENHDELATTLCEAGATVRLRLIYYAGPLTTAVSRCA